MLLSLRSCFSALLTRIGGSLFLGIVSRTTEMPHQQNLAQPAAGTDNHKPEPMPIEYMLLKDLPVALSKCPMCDAQPFIPFLRGTVQRSKRRWWIILPQAYCALICSSCKEIVGYESPEPLTYPL
jgi:hypothetical protein